MSNVKTAAAKTSTADLAPDMGDAAPLLVVDVRKRQKRSRIRDLRRGEGRLLEQVKEMVADLRKEHAIEGKVQPIVLVVRERERRMRLF
jgi:hypothetical protein